MPVPRRPALARPVRSSFLFVLGCLVAACSGDGGSPVGPGPGGSSDSVQPVVGSWTADSIVVSPKVNPDVTRDLVSEDGVTFTFSVQPSGSYAATMTAFGDSGVETGTIRLSGSTIVFEVRTPVSQQTQGVWRREGTRLILESELVLDFNQDGTPEELDTRFVLSPQ